MEDIVFWENVRYYLAITCPILIGLMGVIILRQEVGSHRRLVKSIWFILSIFAVSIIMTYLMFFQLEAQAMLIGPDMPLILKGAYRALYPLLSGIFASLSIGVFILLNHRASAIRNHQE